MGSQIGGILKIELSFQGFAEAQNAYDILRKQFGGTEGEKDINKEIYYLVSTIDVDYNYEGDIVGIFNTESEAIAARRSNYDNVMTREDYIEKYCTDELDDSDEDDSDGIASETNISIGDYGYDLLLVRDECDFSDSLFIELNPNTLVLYNTIYHGCGESEDFYVVDDKVKKAIEGINKSLNQISFEVKVRLYSECGYS